VPDSDVPDTTLPDTPLPPGGDGRTPSTGGVTRAGAIAETMVTAAAAANDAVVKSARPEAAGNPPSCTYVAGVLELTPHGPLLVVSWIGDSRAYWVPDSATGHRPERLSTDDSWAAEEIALGVPRETAESGPHAHAITRWLGPDAPDLRPHRVARLLEGPGWVVLCSDGLWNYCSEPTALAETMRSVSAADTGSGEGSEVGDLPSADPLALAQGLVAWANAQGGQDNITVALARVQG
jgi:serine/threonine protein phosphatase PrpC